MSQEQDIKYIAPQTKQAMIEYATEELMSLLRELPGGNSLSDKKIEVAPPVDTSGITWIGNVSQECRNKATSLWGKIPQNVKSKFYIDLRLI